MRSQPVGRLAAAALLSISFPFALAQARSTEPSSRPSAPKDTPAAEAHPVVVPAVVYDKKGLVTTLQEKDFAITVDGKPQTVKTFARDADLPVTVGLLVDVSRSQTTLLDEDQKASQRFLDSFLKATAPSRSADRAFVLQFAHSAELLQDVTDAHPLLEAGLKEIGTTAPGASDDEEQQADTTGSTNPNSPGSNNGGYGRRGGYPGGGSPSGNGGSGSARPSQARSGTVLYDALYLAANDLMSKQRGRRVLIVLTDGVDRHSKESLKEAIEAAQRADTVVYAIYGKGEDRREFNNNRPYNGYPGYGYPGYGGPGYPGSGGRPGSDGTYADPDGKKILQRICTETGGHMYERKGKGAIDNIYKEIGDELRAQYRLTFAPSYEAASPGYHPIQLSLTDPNDRKFEIQTRDGYYAGPAASQ